MLPETLAPGASMQRLWCYMHSQNATGNEKSMDVERTEPRNDAANAQGLGPFHRRRA